MMFARLVVSVFVGVVVSVSGAFAEPEVFSDAGYEADHAAAAENDKLHVIYFTASWCPPCNKMKKTTWVDESVVGWLEEHAVVSAIDVDEHQGISQDYSVSAMPTIVVYRGDEEIGRTVGYQSSVELRAWLVRAKAGEIENSFVAPALGDRVDIQAKLDEARGLRNSNKFDEATDAYEWLWDNMCDHDEAYVGVRSSFMAAEMEQLAQGHATAKQRFSELRDREQKILESGDVSWDRLSDWVVLNGVIGDDDATIKWLRRVAVEQDRPESVRRLLYHYKAMLVERREYALLGKIIDPVHEAGQTLMIHRMVMSRDEEAAEMMRETVLGSLREELGLYHTIALVQGDEPAARVIAELLLDFDDSEASRASLAAAAKEAGVEPIGLP